MDGDGLRYDNPKDSNPKDKIPVTLDDGDNDGDKDGDGGDGVAMVK